MPRKIKHRPDPHPDYGDWEEDVLESYTSPGYEEGGDSEYWDNLGKCPLCNFEHAFINKHREHMLKEHGMKWVPWKGYLPKDLADQL